MTPNILADFTILKALPLALRETLDNVGVRDMGLKSLLKSSIEAPFGTGGTSVSFHIRVGL